MYFIIKLSIFVFRTCDEEVEQFYSNHEIGLKKCMYYRLLIVAQWLEPQCDSLAAQVRFLACLTQGLLLHRHGKSGDLGDPGSLKILQIEENLNKNIKYSLQKHI